MTVFVFFDPSGKVIVVTVFHSPLEKRLGETSWEEERTLVHPLASLAAPRLPQA